MKVSSILVAFIGLSQLSGCATEKIEQGRRKEINSSATFFLKDTVSQRSAAPISVGPELEVVGTESRYPYEVKVFSLRSQDQALEMAYMDEVGPNPNGKTILLLHGFDLASAYWQRTIFALTSHGYRVLAPDQIGFGKSSQPVRYQFSFSTLASNTIKLLDNLQIRRLSIIGHSMGGMLAVRLALQYKDRIERLVLLNPLGLEDWQDVVPYKTIETRYHENLTVTKRETEKFIETNYYGGSWSPFFNDTLALVSAWQRLPNRTLVAWERALIADMIFTQPIVQSLGFLDPPTLLIIGQLDRTALGRSDVSDIQSALLGDYPKLGKAAAKKIRHSKLVELPMAGHFPHLDSFDATINEIGSFLTSEQ